MNNLGNKETMAENIQYYLDLNGKERNDLCRDLGFKYTTVSNWLQGVKYPRIDKIEIMARYFGVSKADLVEKRTENSPPLASASAPAPKSSSLTKKERELITAYRTAPKRVQKIVDLNLEEYWPKYIEPAPGVALESDILLVRGERIAQQILSYIEASDDFRVTLHIDDYKKLLSQKGVRRFLAEVIDEVEFQQGDVDRAYDIIAEEVTGGNFKEKYVNRGAVGRRNLLLRIRNRFKP
jgi:transcriptional regulator with XRE-family HTH domain